MRVSKQLAAVAAVSLLGMGLTACGSTTTTSCKGNTCNVTVKTKSSKEVTVLDSKFKIANISDTSVDVTQGSAKKMIKEGESATLGRYTVKVTDAKRGEAKLVISR